MASHHYHWSTKHSLTAPISSALKLRSGPQFANPTAPLRATHPPSQPLASQAHDNAVRFYHAYEPYYEFTNFYPKTVNIMGKDWPSTEHFFQAQKYVGTPIAERIRKCGSAREAFEMARKPQYQAWLRPDWHKGVKDDVMHLAVKEKFAQHEDLHKMLLQTGEREIIEHTTNDSYWGDGGGWGRGQNKLGKILMQVRDELKQSQPHDACKERFLPRRSRSGDRESGRNGSSSRPRSGSVGRMPQRMHEYGYEHTSRRDSQLTAGRGGQGRESLSRRDGQPTTGGRGTGRGYSSGRDGQPTAGSGGTGRGAVSRGGQGKTAPQSTQSRVNSTHNQQPLRPTSTSQSRSNDSSQMYDVLCHSLYRIT